MGLQQEKEVIYITKWALTQGILKGEVDYKSKMEEHMYVKAKGLIGMLCVRQDAFFTLEEAQAKAEDMRRRKIVSLRKQIAKLEEMKIKIK